MIFRMKREDDGFTLLEVLVTLAVLAIGVALTLSLISGAIRNIRKSQLRTRTIQHAETVLELTLLDESIKRATSLAGDYEDGTRWALAVNEVEMPPPPQAVGQRMEMPVKLLSYTVEVFAPDSQAPDLVLQTLKIVSALQQPSSPPRMP